MLVPGKVRGCSDVVPERVRSCSEYVGTKEGKGLQ